MSSVNGRVIDGFRAGGEIGVEGMHRERLVLLTTTGSRTGERRTTPLMRIPWEDGVLEAAPFFADMEQRAGRELPLVALSPA